MSSDFRIVVAIDLKSGTNRLMTETQRYALALNAVVDIIHVAPPDPDFVGYMKSGDLPLKKRRITSYGIQRPKHCVTSISKRKSWQQRCVRMEFASNGL